MPSHLHDPIVSLEYILNLLESEATKRGMTDQTKEACAKARLQIEALRALAENHQQLLDTKDDDYGK